nr:hypothetical protein [Arthrobacter sedimenti]
MRLLRDACRLGSSLLLEVREDLRTFGAGFLTDPVGLGASLHELLLVLVERRVGLGLGGLGLGDTAFDRLGARCEGLLERRHDVLDDDEHQHGEAGKGYKEFPPVRCERARSLFRRHNCCVKHFSPVFLQRVFDRSGRGVRRR